MKVMKNNPRCYINRLRKLADFLETVPKEQFDYGELGVVKECGTVACAVGWAPFVPAFKKAGLGAVIKGDYHYGRWNTPTINGKEVSFYDVGDRFFGLVDKEFSFLFVPGYRGAPGCTATAKTVAKHIRKFCDKKQKELGL